MKENDHAMFESSSPHAAATNAEIFRRASAAIASRRGKDLKCIGDYAHDVLASLCGSISDRGRLAEADIAEIQGW